jgi:hypothetical protein
MLITSFHVRLIKAPLTILLTSITFFQSHALSMRCSELFSTDQVTRSSDLDKIRSRLSPKVTEQFEFEMLRLPTVEDARKSKNKMGLSEDFLDSLSKNSMMGESEPVIPLSGQQSSKFVRLFRVVTFKQPIQDFDINHNYKYGNALYAWRGDFVTHNLAWNWVYAGGLGKDILAEYLVPARLLEIDLTTRKQEPYYVISKSKLMRAGITNVGNFLNRLGQVDRYKFEDPYWEPDFRFDDNGPPLLGEPPKTLQDERIKWVDNTILEAIIQNGEQ